MTQNNNQIEPNAQSLQMAVSDSCGSLKITCEDNMQTMARYPDKYFDLAIVDPPYGMPKDSTHGRGKLKNRMLNNGAN